MARICSRRKWNDSCPRHSQKELMQAEGIAGMSLLRAAGRLHLSARMRGRLRDTGAGREGVHCQEHMEDTGKWITWLSILNPLDKNNIPVHR